MSIIYLHGFNSDDQSATIKEIRKHIPELVSISYDYIKADIAYQQILRLIINTLEKNADLILGGTSLGGFWANYFAQKFQLKCLLVNPAINPSASLRQAVEYSPLLNYNSGIARTFTLEDADAYKKFEVPVESGISRVIILGTNDQVIDYRKSAALYRHKAKIILTEEGHNIIDFDRVVKILSEMVLTR